MRNKTMTVKILFGAAFACFCLGCAAWNGDADVAKTAQAETTTVTADGFVMQNGASVKMTDGNGLRFTANLPDSLYQSGYTYGMLIAPAEYVEQNAFTYENVFGDNAVYDWADGTTYSGTKTRIINITYTYDDLQTRTDDGYLLRGSILQIKDENIARSFVGRAYAKDANGNVTFAKYYEDTSANNTRSMYTVATAAIADTNSTLSAEQKSSLEAKYVEKLFTDVTYTTTDGYTTFITTKNTTSASSISTSIADFSDVTLPSGYTTMHKLYAGYGLNYQIFANVDLNAYERLRFSVYRLDGSLSFPNNSCPEKEWKEIELVKKNGTWHISSPWGDVAMTEENWSGTELGGNFALTELRGIKSADTAVRYHTVTYFDVNGNKLHSEKVKEGKSANGYTATLPSSTTDSDGYTHEYADGQWKNADGTAADWSNVTTDQKVYFGYTEQIWKTEGAKTSVYPLTAVTAINKYVTADTNGNVTFKLRVAEGSVLRVSDNTGWTASYGDSAIWIDTGVTYTVTINGTTKEFVLWNGETQVKSVTLGTLNLATLAMDARTSDTYFVPLEIGATETVKYVPTYKVTYYDENGNKLHTENVKDGESATYTYAGTALENGYTDLYTDVTWVTEQGGETKADLSAVNGDTKVYLKLGGTHLLSMKHELSLTNADSNNWTIIGKALTAVNENITLNNDKYELYVKTSDDDMLVQFIDGAWAVQIGQELTGGEWHKIVIEFADGVGKSATIYSQNGAVEYSNTNISALTPTNFTVWAKTKRLDWSYKNYAATGTVEFAARVPSVYTVTYHGEDGEILSSEQVKEGEKANGYTVSLPSKRTDNNGYTHEYLGVQWQTKDGSAADLSAVNGDLHVYPGFEKLVWKTAVAFDRVSAYPLLASLNKYAVADENGNLTIKLRTDANGGGSFALYPKTGWYEGIDALAFSYWMNQGEWYTLSIDKENNMLYWSDKNNSQLASKDISSWGTTTSAFGLVLNVAMDVGVIETEKYAPIYTVTYYDKNGEVLYTDRVKEGGASSFTVAKDSQTDNDGYTHEYTDLQWQYADGSVADLSAINGNKQVYAAFKETIWTTATPYNDNDGTNYKTLVSVNKYAKADENGNLTFKIRLNGSTGNSFTLYEKQSWNDNNYGVWLDGTDWYTVTIDGVNKHITVTDKDGKVWNGYDKDIAWYTPETLSIVFGSNMDLAAITTEYTQQAITEITEIAVLSKYESYSGDRRIGTLQDAVSDFGTFLSEATGKTYTVNHVEDFNGLDSNTRYFILDFGTEEWLTNGLTTDTGYRIAERNGNLYLYGKTAYGTRRAVYALLKQAFDYEFYTDEVYTYTKGAFDYGKITETTFNPSIDYNWSSSVAEYKNSKDKSTLEDRAYTNRLNMIYSSWELTGGYHNFLTVLPQDTYGSAHSKWYVDVTLPDSKFYNKQTFTTLNLAYGLSAADNGAMAKAVAKYVYDQMQADDASGWTENRGMFVFGAPDYLGWQSTTKDYQTKYGSNSAEYLLFMNLVAEKLSAMNPTREMKLIMMAYGLTLDAPTQNTDDLTFYNDGKVSVNVMFAPCSSNFYLSLDDEHTGYTFHDELGDKYAQYYKKSNAEYKAELEKWSALAKKSGTEVLCFYYSAHYDNYFVPLDSLTNMQSKYKTFVENGVTNLYNMGPTGDDVFTDWNALKIYMQSKYAEDAYRTDGETLMLNFCKAYYGEAAGQTMYDLWKAEAAQYKVASDYYIKENGGDPIGCHLIRGMLFNKACWGNDSGAMLKEWYGKIEAALAVTTEDSAEYNRIKTEGLNIRYLLIAVYGDTTYGDIASVRSDAQALGIDIFAESVGYTSGGESKDKDIKNLA